MENFLISYKKITLVIKNEVIENIKNIVASSPLENGGILYGYKIKCKNEFIISGFTAKQNLDNATFAGFERIDPSHMDILHNVWKNDKYIMYLGDWHYHPAKFVYASPTDYVSFEKNTIECTTSSKYLFYLIFSNKEIEVFIYKKNGILFKSQKFNL